MKLDKKDEFLGFKKEKTFALVANYADKTLIRNEMSYQLGRDILKNMSWNPSTKYVHFFLNDSYEGVYMICETVKINESRVNVPNIEDCKNTTEIHKYGFIVEVNDRQDDICNFITPYGVKFSMKDPDGENLSEEIKKYIKNTVINYENALYSSDFNNPVSQNYFYKYFDTNSFIDWWIVNEIGKNVDANFHYSCFMYLDPSDQKLHMGPLWDFDIANGNVNFTDAQYYSGWWINQTKWLKQMFADPVFVIKAKRRWNDKKTEIDNWVNNLIQEKANSLQNDVMRNFYRWPILGTYVWPNAAGYANRTTYQSEIDFFKTWTKNRIDWMDMEINGW